MKFRGEIQMTTLCNKNNNNDKMSSSDDRRVILDRRTVFGRYKDYFAYCFSARSRLLTRRNAL